MFLELNVQGYKMQLKHIFKHIIRHNTY